MADKIEPREVVFGERYGDNSGYEWRVALVDAGDGTRRIEVGERNNRVWIDPATVTVGDIAKAFSEIARLVGEDQ